MRTARFFILSAHLALASAAVLAQTGAPATGSNAATGSDPAARADSKSQNPSVNGYKDSQPAVDASGKARKKTSDSMRKEPTGNDSMTKDNMPKHPATDGQKSQ